MAKKYPDATYRAILDKIATSNLLLVTNGDAADRAAALAQARAQIALTPGLGGASFTEEPGSISGRQVRVAEQSSVPVTSTGNVDHVVLVDDTALIAQTTTPAQTLTNGIPIDVASFACQFLDPT